MSRKKWTPEPFESDENTGIFYSTSPDEKKALETAKRDRRRRKIEQEIFKTEKTYLGQLELIHKGFWGVSLVAETGGTIELDPNILMLDYFDFPLRFACIIPDDAHSRIFSNCEQIYNVNQQLLELMEQNTVGQAFHYLGPFLKLYSTYANNHEQSINKLQEWKQKKPAFASYIEKQEERPEVKGLKLNALLITPVQRIPRYKLLLEDLLQHTSENHHDYHHLEEATRQIGEIATHINEHIRQHENFQKMLSIQNCFDSSAPKILAPGRVFIKEGPLKKVARKGCKSHERMFFLFSDILLYGKPKLLDGGSRTYSCCCVLPLKHCQINPLFLTAASQSQGGGMFQVCCKEESLLLYSDDKQNAKAWSDALEKAVAKLRNDRQTLRKPSSQKIPLRGRSIRKHLQKEKKADPLVKKLFVDRAPGPKRLVKRFEPVSEVKDCSPLREKLAPVRDRIQSWCDDDVGICLSPWSPRRGQDNQENENTDDSETFSEMPNINPCFNADDTISQFERTEPHLRPDPISQRCRPLSDPGVSCPSAFDKLSVPRPSPQHCRLNTRLRSYIQKPLQRLLRARHQLRGTCSPFRTSSVPPSASSSHRLHFK